VIAAQTPVVTPSTFCINNLTIENITPEEVLELYARSAIPGYFSQQEQDPLTLFHEVTYKQGEMPNLDLRVQAHIDKLVSGKSSELRQKLISGKVLPRLVVVVHQKEFLQAETAAVLREDYEDVPRLFLISLSYPAKDPNFAKEASYFNLSYGGEFNRLSLAHEVTLMGGYTNACLARAVEGLIEQAEKANLEELTLRFRTSLIYEGSDSSQKWNLYPSAKEEDFVPDIFRTVASKLEDRIEVRKNSYQNLGHEQSIIFIAQPSLLRINMVFEK